MSDVRMKAWIRAIEARYSGVEAVVEPWTDPDGDRRIRWWVEILHVRERDWAELRELASRLALDLYGEEGATFCFTVNGARGTAAYLAHRREVEDRERRFRRRRPGRASTPGGQRDRRVTRAGRS